MYPPRSLRLPLLLAPLILAMAALAAPAENWPGWRGPHGDGSSDEPSAPVRWSGTENIRWKVEIPGGGHSSPIIWHDAMFLTTATDHNQRRMLLRLDRTTGRTVWQREVLRAPPEHKHPFNSFASATPATDGERVYVSFLAVDRIVVVAYDFAGREVWRQSPGVFSSIHGFCSSPVIYRDLVLLNGDHDGPAYLVAMDRHSGAIRWKVPRENHTRSYCTPLLITVKGKTEMVLSGNKCVAAYDPDTGKRIWIIDGPTDQMVASLVYTDGILFVTTGFPEHHILGVDPTGTGNVTNTAIRWRTVPGAAYVPSPVAYRHWFFLASDTGGIASCFEARTGKKEWQRRLSGNFSASAVEAAGKVYFTRDDGLTFVLEASPKFKVISRNHLGEEVRASPAVSGGALFIRGIQHLYCIEDPGTTTAHARRLTAGRK